MAAILIRGRWVKIRSLIYHGDLSVCIFVQWVSGGSFVPIWGKSSVNYIFIRYIKGRVLSNYSPKLLCHLLNTWNHDDVIKMEAFSALMAICAGNSPTSGEFPTQRPVTRSFDVFFYLCLNKRVRKQSWGWWFAALSRPLWRHCNVKEIFSVRWFQTWFSTMINKVLCI